MVHFNTGRNSRDVDSIIQDVDNSLSMLIANGVENIMMMNLPDLTKTPSILYHLKKNDPVELGYKIQDYNNKLVKLVASKRMDGVKVFDLYSLMSAMLNNPSEYGFENTTQACLNINDDNSTNYIKNPLGSAWGFRSTCYDPNKFVFWDILHPTTHAHNEIAIAVADFIHKNYNM